MSKTTNKFAPEVRDRAIRMVLDHERAHPRQAPEKHHACRSLLPKLVYAFRRSSARSDNFRSAP